MKSLTKIFYLPPPNITGKLHIGHALNCILTDIIIRKTKSLGYKTIWIPGFDHAGISTQILMEKYLSNYGINKTNINKSRFIKFIKLWKIKYNLIITKQIKKLNILLNWKLKYFTLNKKVSKLTKKIFLRLYKKNLIKKLYSLINWDYILKSNLSDFEIKIFYKYIVISKLKLFFINKKGFLKFNIKNLNYINKYKNIFFIKNFIFLYKKSIILPLTNNKINFIFYDENFILKKFCYFKKKIFYKIYKNLKFLIFYLNLKKKNIIISYLYKYILIKKSIKTDTKIKYKIKNQWFILINKKYTNYKTKIKKSLKSNIILKIKNLKILPNKWSYIYKYWVKSIKNWCISRQIWWGHKIPIFYKKKYIFIINNFYKKKIYKIYKYNIKKETDVLDTWFSSSLIPIISKYLIKLKFNYKNYMISELLTTGYDIIFFWVIKMILFSLYFLKKLPFKKLYIHGLIVDILGKKMSKSKGNIINPIDLLNDLKIKPDILRFILSSLSIKKKFIKFNLLNYNFCNYFYDKLLNISNYVFINCNIYKNLIFIKYKNKNYTNSLIINKWLLSVLEKVKISIEKEFKSYKINSINKILYKFTKIIYSNWFLEISKILIKKTSINIKYDQCKYIIYSFYELLKLLYPVMPDIVNKLFKFLFKLFKKYNIIINNCKIKFLINYLFLNLEIQFINKNIKILKIKYFKFIKILRKNKLINKNLLIILLFIKNYKFINFKNYTQIFLKLKNFKLITNKIYY